MPLARFAHLHAPIDDARRKAAAPAIDDLGAFGRFGVAGDNHPVLNGQGAVDLNPGFGINQAGIGKMQDHAASFWMRSSSL